jgi:hypothetical protein
MIAGFGPLKTLAESLDEERRNELMGEWVDLTETMREGDEIAHQRQYLLVLGARR